MRRDGYLAAGRVRGDVMGDIYQSGMIHHFPENIKHGARNWSLGNKDGTLVTVSLDTGKITFGEHYTPDEAARVFWEAIANMRKLVA